MRAMRHLEIHPTEPQDGDEKRLRALYGRKRWFDESENERGNNKKEKRGDFLKAYSQVKDLRKSNAVRRSGTLATTSGLSYKHPSRFAADRDAQSDLFVALSTQAWPGVSDTAFSAHGRGKDLCTYNSFTTDFVHYIIVYFLVIITEFVRYITVFGINVKF
jgi:hypothetical protein